MSNYFLNRKTFNALRALDKDCSTRWSYMHVSKDGVTCTDQTSFIRVTLPTVPLSAEPRIYPKATIEDLKPKSDKDLVKLPDGLEAKSSGEYSVPNYDYVLPKQNEVQASITINGKKLIELLKAATDVTEHSLSLMRLSICKDGSMLKIETHRNENEQEFVGLLTTLQYGGVNIPNSVLPSNGAAPVEKTETTKLTLPIQGGRKFRE